MTQSNTPRKPRPLSRLLARAFGMGLAQSQKGSLLQSIASLEKAVQLSPSFSLATSFLAASYARLGDLVHAEGLMEESGREASHSMCRHYVSQFTSCPETCGQNVRISAGCFGRT